MRRETVSNRPGVNRLRYQPVFSLRNRYCYVGFLYASWKDLEFYFGIFCEICSTEMKMRFYRKVFRDKKKKNNR